MHRFLRGRSALPVVLLVGCALLFGEFASAEPPPPDFDNWNIVNELHEDVTNIQVTLYKGKPPNYWVEDGLEEAMTFTLPKLAAVDSGHTCKLKLSLVDVWCIARITLTASCGSGSVSFDETAESGEFTVPPDTKPEYSGFTDNNGSTVLRVKFYRDAGVYKARFEAKSRWGAHEFPYDIVKVFQP